MYSFFKKINKITRNYRFVVDYLMLIIAIAGICFIKQELYEIRLQNELNREAIVQSYRPVGYLLQITEENKKEKETFELGYKFYNDSLLSLHYPLKLQNIGNGVLILCGFIYYYTNNSKYNFREEILNKKIDYKRIIFDKYYNIVRGTIIRTFDDFRDVNIILDSLKVETDVNTIKNQKYFFIHILIFYKDQSNNLYDTYSIIQQDMKQPKTIIVNKINQYNGRERDILVSVLKEHPMVEAIKANN